jgi:hypothetical protein
MAKPCIKKGSIWWCSNRDKYGVVEYANSARVRGMWTDGGTFDYDRITFLKDFNPPTRSDNL